LNLYKFEQVFQNRKLTATEGDRWKFIPPECKVLEGGGDSLLNPAERAVLEEKYSGGMILWNANRYHLCFQEIIQRLTTGPPEIALPTAQREELLARLDTIVDRQSRNEQMVSPGGKLDMVNLEWWNDLFPQANVLIEQYLNPSGAAAFQQQIITVEDMLEFRHKVTEDLRDESYTIRVDMPGRVMRSTTQVMEKGVLVWKLLGQDIDDADVTLQATSIYLHAVNMVVSLGCLVILILVIRARGKHVHKRTMTGPPPPPKK
jgi:hypothetical protein